MKRFGSLFPFLEQGVRHAHIGRLVANDEFVRALLMYGRFDEYLFGSPSRSNLAEFREALAPLAGAGGRPHMRFADYAEWPALLDAEAFHVMHLGGWGYFMPGLHYLRLQRAPRLWPITGIIHSLHGRETIDHAVRLASAELLPCDAIFCTSRDGRTALQGLLDGAAAIVGRTFRGQLITAPLGIDDALVDKPGDRARARLRLRIPDDAGVVLVLGRMSAAQKMDLGPLCQAFARLILPHATRPVFLVFAGGASPGELEVLRGSITRYGLEGHVRLQANFAADQKRDVLAMADVLVAPTDNVQETFGLSLLEAQAAGVPVVASRYDGYKDLVRDGVDGFLVDTWQAPADPFAEWFDVMDGTAAQLSYAQGLVVDMNQLADRVVRLLGDAELRRRLGGAGREKVDRDYRWSRVIAQYEDLWDELAKAASTCTRPEAVPNPFALAPSTVFGHYASHTLHGDTMVIAGDRHIEELPYRDVAGWLDVRLLEKFLDLARRPTRAADVIARSGVPGPHAWFAVAWLLKYGLLEQSEPSFSQPLPETADFHA